MLITSFLEKRAVRTSGRMFGAPVIVVIQVEHLGTETPRELKGEYFSVDDSSMVDQKSPPEER
jgi:hypothetical protein